MHVTNNVARRGRDESDIAVLLFGLGGNLAHYTKTIMQVRCRNATASPWYNSA
jgi:hypothetical protein